MIGSRAVQYTSGIVRQIGKYSRVDHLVGIGVLVKYRLLDDIYSDPVHDVLEDGYSFVSSGSSVRGNGDLVFRCQFQN